MIVDPKDLFSGSVFRCFKVAPWAASVNKFSFKQVVDLLSPNTVIGIPDAAHRRCNHRLCQPLGVPNLQILRPAVRVMQRLVLCWPALIIGLLKSVEDHANMCRAPCPRTNDPLGKHVDDESHIDKQLPRYDIGVILDRWQVGCRRKEPCGSPSPLEEVIPCQ